MLHSIGFAPATALGGVFLETTWEDVATTLHTSAFSLKSLAVAASGLMTDGGSIVGMDFDARQAWPAYDWMGVAKAALESTARYLARDLGPRGIRVNLVAAGPIRTMAAKSIPGFGDLEDAWTHRAPLGWDTSDPTPVARAVRRAALGSLSGHHGIDDHGGRRLPRAGIQRRGGAAAGRRSDLTARSAGTAVPTAARRHSATAAARGRSASSTAAT